MAETIEALLEENLGSVQQLLAVSEAAHASVQVLDQLATELDENAMSRGGSTVDSLRQLQTTLTALDEALNESEQQHQSEVELAAERVTECQQSSREQAQEISQAANSLRSRLSALDASLASRETTLTTELQDLTSQNGKLDSLANAKSDEIRQQLQEFQEQMNSQLTALQSERSGLEADFGMLTDQSQQQLAAAMSAMDKGVEETEQRLNASKESTSAVRESTTAAMRQKLAGDGIQTVTQQFSEMGSTLKVVTDTTQKLGLDLGDSLGGVMDTLEDIVGIVKKIEPALKLADELL